MDDDKEMKPSGIRPFNDTVDSQLLELEWSDWKREFEIWCELKKEMSQREKFLWLMNKAGRELHRIYYTLKPIVSEIQLNPPYAEQEYDNAIIRLDAYFASKSNPILVMDSFRRLNQEAGEPFSKSILRLRRNATRCNFGSKEVEEQNIVHQIAKGARLQKVCEKAMIGNLSFEELVKYANAQEVLESQRPKDEEIDTKTISFVRPGKGRDFRQRPYEFRGQGNSFNRRIQGNRNENENCERCGSKHGSFRGCAAKGKNCFNCGGVGHFASKCRSKRSDNRYSSGGGSHRNERFNANRNEGIHSLDGHRYEESNDWEVQIPMKPDDGEIQVKRN